MEWKSLLLGKVFFYLVYGQGDRMIYLYGKENIIQRERFRVED
jgi:hypothetical protein